MLSDSDTSVTMSSSTLTAMLDDTNNTSGVESSDVSNIYFLYPHK